MAPQYTWNLVESDREAGIIFTFDYFPLSAMSEGIYCLSRRQGYFAERRMLCLLVTSYTHVCLRFVFICWKGLNTILWCPFHPIKSNHKETWEKLTASKYCIRRLTRQEKTKVKNDHRNKFSNLSNWKEEAWKSQGFPLKPWFFRLLLSNCLNWKIYCDDHSSLSSTTAVQIWIISYILHITRKDHAYLDCNLQK